MAIESHLAELEKRHQALEQQINEALAHLSTDDLTIAELKRRKLEVLRSERISPSMVRLVLGGDDLAGFVSLGFDDHVKIFIPPPGATSVNVTLSGTAFDGSPALSPLTGLPSPTTTSAASANCGMGQAYSFPNIPNGTYELAFQATGFDPYTLTNVVVNGANTQASSQNNNSTEQGNWQSQEGSAS